MKVQQRSPIQDATIALHLHEPAGRTALVLAATAVYVLGYLILNPQQEGVAVFALLPVMVAALVWGLRGGLIAGILTAPINLFILHFFRGIRIDASLLYEIIPAHLMLLIAGLALGYLSQLRSSLENNLEIRRKSETALRTSERKFRRLIAGLSDGIYLIDENGRVIEWNPAMERLTGLKRREAIDQPALDVWRRIARPEQRAFHNQESLERGLDEFKRTGNSPWLNRVVERKIQRADGTLVFVEEVAFPLRTPNGFMLGAILRDISERKAAQDYERAQRVVAETMREATAAVSRSLDFNEVLDNILSSVSKVVPHDAACIQLVQDGAVVEIRARGFNDHQTGPPGDAMESLAVGTPHLLQMATSGEPIIIADKSSYPGWLPWPNTPDLIAYVGAPILIKDELAGCIYLAHQQPDFYKQEHAGRLQLFADQAAFAIENARLFNAVQRYARQVALLNEVTRIALLAPDLAAILDSLAYSLGELFDSDGAYIATWNDKERQFIPAAARGLRKEYFLQMAFCAQATNLCRSVLESGQVLVLGNTLIDSPDDPVFIPEIVKEKALLVMPLIDAGAWLGAAIVTFNERRSFSPGDLALAEQAAMQVALSFSKSRSLEAERQRSAELAHANAVITALSHVAAAIERAPEPDALLNTLGEELGKLNIACLVALADPDDSNLRVRYLSIHPRALVLLEKITKIQLSDFRISPETILQFDEIMIRRRPVFMKNPFENLCNAIPTQTTGGASRLARLIGLGLETRSAALPMVAEEQVLGVLCLWSKELQENDLPALSLFASQLAVAMENARLYSEVQKLAITDALTGVYNRRGLEELGRREIERAHRFSRPLSAVMLDLDHFKRINDRFGHLIGDQALKGVVQRCLEKVRDLDLVGRYGGEEFLVLLPETGLDEALIVAERIRHGICQRPVHTDRGEVEITVSLGATELTEKMQDLSDLVAAADEALYIAKNAGRNRVIAATERHFLHHPNPPQN